MRTGARIVLAAALTMAGCTRLSGDGEGGPELVVEWTGSDTGRLVASARVEWCDALRMLEVRGVHGDSGLALAIYPVGPARPDSYAVVAPEDADSLRPAAAVALRWFAETAVKGYQGHRGALVLTRADDRATGRFEAAMRSINDGTRLDLRGSFRDVPVVPAGRGCAPRPGAEPGDSGVD